MDKKMGRKAYIKLLEISLMREQQNYDAVMKENKEDKELGLKHGESHGWREGFAIGNLDTTKWCLKMAREYL